jgi:hypothetical protein
MGNAAKATRANRTMTVDFQDESTYLQLLSDGKAFVEFIVAFLLALGFQLTHKASCHGGGCRHWFRLLQINLCSAFKPLFVSKISPAGRSSLLTLLTLLQELDEL